MSLDRSEIEPPFQLSLPVFEGRVEELLQLVTQRKIATADFEVRDFTAQFRTYIGRGGADLDATGEFVAASARILAIKSADLLVIDTDADDMQNDEPLRSPDSMLRDVAGVLGMREGKESFAPLAPHCAVARPIVPRSAHALVRAWGALDRRTRSRVTRLAVPPFVRLEAALSALIRQLRAHMRVSFQTLVDGCSREDAVVHFMAVLELVRRHRATASQPELLGDITIAWVEGETESAARAG
jgi:segregation and condensation protein A